jgi:ribosomal-protein-alanine N-acetyltransferase
MGCAQLTRRKFVIGGAAACVSVSVALQLEKEPGQCLTHAEDIYLSYLCKRQEYGSVCVLNFWTFPQTMTDSYSIRRARATDLPAVYAGELDYIRQIEPEQEARWTGGMYWHIKQWTNDLDRMFIAESSEEATGYCFWEVHGNVAVLASIYVLPAKRRVGLGRRLLAEFISDARAQGFTTLTLGVKPDNPARVLYEAAGFVYTHDDGGYRHYAYQVESLTATLPLT